MTLFFMKKTIGIVFAALTILAVTGVWSVWHTQRDEAPFYKKKAEEGVIAELGGGWSRYENARLGFTLEYPSETLKFIFEEGGKTLSIGKPVSISLNGETKTIESFLRLGTIGFSDEKNGYGSMGILVDQPPFSTVDEWLLWEQKFYQYADVIVEKRMTIAGQNALVTYVREKGGYDQPLESRERSTVFFSGETMYSINTSGLLINKDIEQVWKSFHLRNGIR